MPAQEQQLCIFASGAGSNAARIIEHFNGKDLGARVGLVISNRKTAGVIGMAGEKGVATALIDRNSFYSERSCIALLESWHIDWLILAGFLWKIPSVIIERFPSRIINIHPALLPAYGGEGMYGRHVHESVIRNGEKISGITIHYVDEKYDNGDIIFQERCPVLPSDTAETLAERIHQLEYRHYPEVIQQLVNREEADRSRH